MHTKYKIMDGALAEPKGADCIVYEVGQYIASNIPLAYAVCKSMFKFLVSKIQQ